jgi:hypothetical protein
MNIVFRNPSERVLQFMHVATSAVNTWVRTYTFAFNSNRTASHSVSHIADGDNPGRSFEGLK